MKVKADEGAEKQGQDKREAEFPKEILNKTKTEQIFA